jgi:hypothetical protein
MQMVNLFIDYSVMAELSCWQFFFFKLWLIHLKVWLWLCVLNVFFYLLEFVYKLNKGKTF